MRSRRPITFRRGWNAATVPGTVLTSLVNDKVYPEPLYGENNRPDKIPESLCRTSYWYRTTVHRSGRLRPDTRDLAEFRGHQLPRGGVGQRHRTSGSIKGAFARAESFRHQLPT